MNKRPSSRISIISLITIALLSCTGRSPGKAADQYTGGGIYDVFVIQARWHTGIIFSTDDIDKDIWPEIISLQNNIFVDIGWGDEKFYQATGDPVFLAARAILWPTQSVMQIFAFNTPVVAAYGGQGRVLRIPVTRKQLDELSNFISGSYIRDDHGDPIRSSVYGESDHYYLATRKYHLFRTCNTWVASGFRQAGFRVRTFGVLNANQLFRQLSRIPGAEFIN